MWAPGVQWANLLTDQGEATLFVGSWPVFIASDKIPAGRLALGDWLGHYWMTTGVGIFA